MHRVIMSGPRREHAHLAAALTSAGMQTVPDEDAADHGLPHYTDRETAVESSDVDIAFLECVGPLQAIDAAARRLGWSIRVHSDVSNEAYHG